MNDIVSLPMLNSMFIRSQITSAATVEWLNHIQV